jgi:hypothetical protein
MAKKKVREKPELDENGEEKRCFLCGATQNLAYWGLSPVKHVKTCCPSRCFSNFGRNTNP